MKKMISILLVIMLGINLVLSGCGRSDSSAISMNLQETEKQSMGKQDNIIRLRVSGYKSGSEIGAIPQLNEKFMHENPNIKVIYEGMPGMQFNEFIKTRFAVNDASDVIMLHPGLTEISKYAKSGYILDLTDEPWMKVFSPSALAAVSYDNKVYGIPNDMVVLGVYYSKSIFEQLSLKIPRNWDEFVSVCEKIKAAKITPISIGNNDGWMTLAALYSMWPSLNTDAAFDQKLNARTITYNGSWNEMLAQWYALDDKGYLTANSTDLSLDKAQSEFAAENAAMYIDGSWSMAGILKKNPSLKFGMFPMPANKQSGDTVVSAAVGTSWVINKKTTHLEAAKLYLEFWSKEENLTTWTKSQDSFITLKGIKSEVAPELSEISQALAAGKTFPFLDQGWEQAYAVQTELMSSAQGVYLKAITQEQMLKKMDDAWDAAINQ
jgi:raffinose/stachyose/melibiose transport system substrate-binding protein